MSRPRKVLPGKTYLITRRTRQRRFFLRPSTTTNLVIRFCLAWAAWHSGVVIHTHCWMSDHPHIVCTDIRGCHPRFTHWLFRHVAVCIKKILGVTENVWAAEKPSVIELTTPEACIEAMAYTLANPTAAGLVRRSKQWPGVISRPEDLLGAEDMAQPPGVFFRNLLARSLRYAMPPMLSDWDPDVVVETVKVRVRELEDEAAAELKRQGRNFLGVAGVLKVEPFSQPKTPASHPESDSRRPRFKSLRRRELSKAWQELCAFWQAYDEALSDLQAGDWEREFPLGTWWMRVHLRVKVSAEE